MTIEHPEDGAWSEAYLRFETPAQEIRKFERRLVALGAREWPRDAAVLELFCGRGSGLHALGRLGFERIVGVDRSARLLAHYDGPAEVVAGDCRALPIASASRDRVVVHGGLHHLDEVPRDLASTLDEARRVLRPGGLLLAVEPWRTPFLELAHFASLRSGLARASRKLDALATMIRHEQTTYYAWLAAGAAIRSAFEARFDLIVWNVRWGKVQVLARAR